MQPSLHLNSPGTTGAPERLGDVISHGIRTPLAALRAAIEALQSDVADSENGRSVLELALSELVRLDHSAEALIELAAPTPLQPLRCSLREIVSSALDSLTADRRSRIWAAVESESQTCQVDGPVLVRVLSAFLEHATDAIDAEVLLHAHRDGDFATFVVIDEVSNNAPAPRPTRRRRRRALA